MQVIDICNRLRINYPNIAAIDHYDPSKSKTRHTFYLYYNYSNKFIGYLVFDGNYVGLVIPKDENVYAGQRDVWKKLDEIYNNSDK